MENHLIHRRVVERFTQAPLKRPGVKSHEGSEPSTLTNKTQTAIIALQNEDLHKLCVLFVTEDTCSNSTTNMSG